MIAHRATLDVPDDLFHIVVCWLSQHRRDHDARPWQRAASCRSQAILVLRCLHDATLIPAAARDICVSRARGYRYFEEAVDVIAEHAPELPAVIARGEAEGWSHLCLDGTLIPTTGCAERSVNGWDAWYSGKHKRHGGNLQVLCDPHGFPVWVSQVEPGSTHDITCARRQVFPALNHAAATSLPVLVDLGYRGADIGHYHPVGRPGIDQRSAERDRFLSALRASTERGNALLKAGWRILRRVTCCPRRITQIARACLVLTHLEYSW